MGARTWIIAAASVVLLVGAYFTWCPRFGHGGETDEQQIATLALANASHAVPPQVYLAHDTALAAWSMQGDQHDEVLFMKRFCRWSLVTTSTTGFDRPTLRTYGVSARDANSLYVQLMEGYAEGL